MPVCPPLLATETRTTVCSLCAGQGDVCTGAAHGTFDMRQEQWFPDERVYTCPRCKGQGELEEDFCLACTESVEVCRCMDADIDTYLLTACLGAA
jgi:DnaJ-class molecular chaperone